jgi:phosphoribosylanthranilate isomerase
VPVIASGGVASTDELLELAKIDGVEGAIVGKALYTGAFGLEDALRVFT